jgi:hypothetical protein
MEYELEEDALLFDDSTNPSLEHQQRRPSEGPTAPRDLAPVKRQPQKAEVIPEEERA